MSATQEVLRERQEMMKLAQEKEAKSHFSQHNRTSDPVKGQRPSSSSKGKGMRSKKCLPQHVCALHTGILLSPQLRCRTGRAPARTGHMHYTQDTANSARRQQPPVSYSTLHCSSSPSVGSPTSCQGSPRSCQDTPSGKLLHSHREGKTPLHSHRKSKIKHKKMSKKNSVPIQFEGECPMHLPKLDEKTGFCCEMEERSFEFGGDGEEDVGATSGDSLGHPPPPTESKLTCAIAEQAQKLELFRQDISQKMAELKAGMVDGQRAASPHTASVALEHFPSLPKAEMADMLKRLDQLVAEEDEIRQRWTTIVYEDPQHSKPPTLLCANRWEHTPPSDSTMVAIPHLSTQNREELEDYRKRYAHHLDLTHKESNPWEMAER